MMRIRNLLIYACIAVGVILPTACSRSAGADATPTIAVSIPAQKWLLDSIVGDRFEVMTLLSAGSNPETFEPSMKQLMALQDCRTFFTVGGLPFETGIMPKIKENFPQMPVVASDTYVTRLHGTHGLHCPEGHEHDGAHHHDSDPHIWTSLRSASAMARAMYEAVVKLDPAGKSHYTTRYQDLVTNLKQLDDSITLTLTPLKGRSFMVWHPSLSYFAEDYGLKQISVENEGKEASVAQYRKQLDTADAGRPLLFFLQREFDSRQGSAMAAEIGVPTAEISVMQADIPAQIRQITHDLTSHH